MPAIRHRLATALLGAALLLPILPVHASQTLIAHNQGTTVIQGIPQRVAVYDMALLDILDALGVKATVVPKSTYTGALAHYSDDAAVMKAGTLFEPDLAAIEEAGTDLILVGGRSAKQYAALTGLAPTLELGTDRNHFTGDIISNTLALGRLFGREGQAARLVSDLLARRAEVAGKLQGQSALSLFVVGGRSVVHAPGERFGFFYELTGLTATVPANTDPEPPRAEAGSEQARAQQSAAAKRLADGLHAGPQWLFVLDRASATGGKNQARSLLAKDAFITASPAWKNDQVIWLDAPTWYLAPGGIRSAQALLDTLASRLQ